MDTKIESIITHFIHTIKKIGVEECTIVIFGSQISGTATRNSDIDIAVISPTFIGLKSIQRLKMVKPAIFAVIDTYDIPVDLILLTPDEFECERSPRMSFIKKGHVFAMPA